MIIAIEGGVGAGKTTLCNGLRDNLPNYISIPEYFDVIPAQHHEFVLSMTEEGKLKKFFEVEEQRKAVLDKSDNPNALLDRSVLTLLSYQYAMDQFDLVSDSIFQARNMSENMILPDVVIHLDVDIKTRKERVSARGYDVHPILLDEGYNNRIKEFCESYASDIQFFSIDTSQLFIDEVLQDASKILSQNLVEVVNKPEKYSNTTANIKNSNGFNGLSYKF